MRAAQVPLRRARGDHGPLTGPQAQAPTGAPRHPRVGSPVIRWPHGAPAPPSTPDLTAMPGTRRRQRGGRRYSYAYRATTCPRPGSTRPRPGRPRPARPRRPGPRTPPACAGRPPGRLAPTAPIASPTPASRAHRPTAVCDTPGPRAAADADQPSAISSIARRRTSPGDPHPTRHIDHSSEPVMVQPPPDTTNCTFECEVHVWALWGPGAPRPADPARPSGRPSWSPSDPGRPSRGPRRRHLSKSVAKAPIAPESRKRIVDIPRFSPPPIPTRGAFATDLDKPPPEAVPRAPPAPPRPAEPVQQAAAIPPVHCRGHSPGAAGRRGRDHALPARACGPGPDVTGCRGPPRPACRRGSRSPGSS